jgi:hypothetical protein
MKSKPLGHTKQRMKLSTGEVELKVYHSLSITDSVEIGDYTWMRVNAVPISEVTRRASMDILNEI